jgi:choice-of-anchor C domain-containing protein
MGQTGLYTLRRPLALAIVLMAAFAVASSPAGQKSLLVNGSFEQGPPVSSYVNVRGGATSIEGWVVTGEGIDYIGSLWAASDGKHSIDLDGSAPSAETPPYDRGGVAQTFATTPGKTYRVTFDMAGNPFHGPIRKPMRVSAANQHMDFTFDITGKNTRNMGWVSETWTFTANSKSTTLEFRSLTVSPGTGWGAVIDNVSVTILDARAQSL